MGQHRGNWRTSPRLGGRGGVWACWFAAALLLAAGLLGLWRGADRAVIAPRRATRAVAQVESLSVRTTLAELRDVPPGQRVLFAGWLAKAAIAAPGVSDGAGCVIRPVRLDDPQGRWQTPPFVLRPFDGDLAIENDDYAVLRDTLDELSAPDAWWTWELPGHPASWGFCVGDPVFVDATVVRRSDGVALRASVVLAGTRDTYLSVLRRNLDPLDIFLGRCILALGVPPLAGGLFCAYLARRLGRARPCAAG